MIAEKTTRAAFLLQLWKATVGASEVIVIIPYDEAVFCHLFSHAIQILKLGWVDKKL